MLNVGVQNRKAYRNNYNENGKGTVKLYERSEKVIQATMVRNDIIPDSFFSVFLRDFKYRVENKTVFNSNIRCLEEYIFRSFLTM